ncbi:MAG: response regulator, partial [Nitrospinae bacterium]|nr:response regulator [Nitrospinota bacterium]
MNDNSLKVLVIDDDEDDIFLVKEMLKEGFPGSSVKMDYVTKDDEAIVHIDNGDYDTILLDLKLGKTNGLHILNHLNQHSLSTPVIILTSHGDQEKAVEVMKAGATDYITKSKLSVELLSSSIRSAIKVRNEKEQRGIAEKSLKAQGELLLGVSRATHKLLTVTDFDSAINQALEELGNSANVEMAFIFKHYQNSDKTTKCSLEYTWADKGEFKGKGVKVENLSYAELGIEEVYQPLVKNQTVVIYEKQGSNFPGEIFKKLNIRSLILIPLEINTNYWGFVALGSRNVDRVWLEYEKSILEAVIASIGGEIKRQIEEDAFRDIV